MVETGIEVINRLNVTSTMAMYGNKMLDYCLECKQKNRPADLYFDNAKLFLTKMVNRYNFIFMGDKYRSLYKALNDNYYIPEYAQGVIKTAINGIIKPSIEDILKNSNYNDIDDAYTCIRKVLFAEEKVIIKAVDLIAAGDEFTKL